MSRSKYAELYDVEDFRPYFEKMFAEKYLFRHMMLSRSEVTAKINHSKKIDVLERAFRERSFLRIN